MASEVTADEHADVKSAEIRFECTACHVRHKMTVTISLSFPGDADAIIDLVEGRINVQECEACGHILSPQPPLMAINTLTGDAVAARVPPEQAAEMQIAWRDSGRAERGEELQVVPGYHELHAVVLAWTRAYMRRATAPLFTDATPERNADGIPLAETPLVLLTMHEQVEGRLAPGVVTEPPVSEERQRELLAGLYVAHVFDVLGSLYKEAFHGDGLSYFPALVERRVPARCLSEAVLAATLEPCKGWDAELLHNQQELSVRLRAEYVNAAAHAAAQRRNPRGREWARFAKVLFYMDRDPQIELPAVVRLSTDPLRRTIRFDEAWDTTAAELLNRSSIDAAAAWFEQLGMLDRFYEQMAAAPVQVDLSKLVDRSDEEIAGMVLAGLEQGAEDADARLVGVTGMGLSIVRAGRPGVARVMFERELDRLANGREWAVLADQTTRAVEVMRSAGEQETATALLSRHLDELKAAPLDPSQRFGLLNEIGNAARHGRERQAALESYHAALEFAEGNPDLSARDLFVLRRNIAIVLRELGRYSEAVSVLDDLERETRGESSARRAELLASLALNYLEAGIPQLALPLTQEARNIPLSGAEIRVRTAVLLAHARARVADNGGMIDEYSEALELTKPMPPFHATAAATTVVGADSGRVPPEVLHYAEQVLEREAALDDRGMDSRRATAIQVLTDYRLNAGDSAAARTLLMPLEEYGLTVDNLPWQLNVLVGRFFAASDLSRAFSAMRGALTKLDAAVPETSGLAFSTPWIGGVAAVQEQITDGYRQAITRGAADPLEYLDLADFLYARDIPAPEELRGAAAADRLRVLAATLPQHVNVTLVIFLELGEDVVALAVNPRQGEPRLERLPMPRAELSAAAECFNRAVGPTCLLPSQKQRAEAHIGEVLAQVGQLLRHQAPPRDQICIVPSPALVGIPLHAVTVDNTPLLEHNPISVAPSLRALHQALARRGSSRGPLPATIVTVPKDGDKDVFRARLDEAADALREGLNSLAGGTLSGRAATKEALLAVFRPGQQVIFLGHGADGGRLYGRGLCVSDGIDLPRGPLPVDLIPQLRSYVVDAADLERTGAAPAVLISMACSSGRAPYGPGGTRIGLERSLFANGANTIVAPLWDVEQEAALKLILTLEASWRDHPDLTLGEHHQRASLAVRNEHPLLFHWGSFSLNGSFL
jgi:tetratricopeptide (TPR) repeat protein